MFHPFIVQFDAMFANEEACIEAVQRWKWPNGFQCWSCGHHEAYRIGTRRLPLFECRNCGTQTSLTSNTMMHKSSTPLKKWLLAMFLVACDSAPLNAVRLAKLLKVTYKTAWRMLHCIRLVISETDSGQLLHGKVEAKLEVYMRKLIPTDENLKKEQSVIVAKGHDSDGTPYVKIKRIQRERQSREPLVGEERAEFKQRYCDPLNAIVHVNGGSQQFQKQLLSMQSIDKRPSISMDWSELTLMGRYPLSIIATAAFQWMNDYFHGIGDKYAQLYMDEYCFRLNRIDHDAGSSMEWLLVRMLAPNPFQAAPRAALKHSRLFDMCNYAS